MDITLGMVFSELGLVFCVDCIDPIEGPRFVNVPGGGFGPTVQRRVRSLLTPIHLHCHYFYEFD